MDKNSEPAINRTKNIQDSKSNTQLILVAGLLPAISSTILAPLQLVRLRMQNMNEMVRAGTIDRPYTGIRDCMSRVYTRQGLRAFWKGNATQVLRIFGYNSINLAFKSQLFSNLVKARKNDQYQPLRDFILRGLTGCATLSVCYPLQYARTRLSNDLKNETTGKSKQFNGLIDVLRKTLASDGISGIYRGLFVSCLGIFIHRATELKLFESLKLISIDKHDFSSFFIGYGVTLLPDLATYPIDTIKRRMMMRSGEKQKYQGFIDCVAKIFKNEGIFPFFRGYSIYFFRSILVGFILAAYIQYQILYSKKQ